MRTCLLLLLLVIGAFSLHAEEGNVVWPAVPRVIAIGDVHGAYPELEFLLAETGLIDESGQWAGGNAHLVSLGDLLDRGSESRRVMDLLMALQPQAEASGGRVHVVLGNHELMNLTDDLRDVSAAEFAAFGGPAGHAQAFAPDGKYGSWLLSLPIVLQVGDSLFMHGGVSSIFDSVESVNRTGSAVLRTVIERGRSLIAEGLIPAGSALLHTTGLERSDATATFIDAADHPLLGALGPLWYRGNAGCHELIEASRIRDALERIGARRVIVGHTPTPEREIVERFGGKVYVIDTGMLHSVYGGNPRALEITKGRVRALSPKGEVAIVRDGTIVNAQYDPLVWATDLSKREQKRAEAAFRLDKLLGFGFMPSARPSLITERQRAERALPRQNYCEVANDYDLLAAFDSLIGKTDRSVDSLAYDTRSWKIVALENHTGFAPSAKVPPYQSTPSLPPELERRLIALSREQLSSELGELLKQREIKGILRRRDEILGWPILN